MGSGRGVGLNFVAPPVAGKAALELLGWEGDSACAPVIADRVLVKNSHHNPWLAGASGWDGLISSAAGKKRACEPCPWLRAQRLQLHKELKWGRGVCPALAQQHPACSAVGHSLGQLWPCQPVQAQPGTAGGQRPPGTTPVASLDVATQFWEEERF